MISGFDTPFPFAFPAVWLCITAGLLVVWSRGFRGLVSPRHRRTILLCRGGAALAVGVLLLQPYRDVRRPDADAFRVVILGDASGSMAVADGPGGERRIDTVRRELDPENASGLAGRLGTRYRCLSYVFSDRLLGAESAADPGGGVLLPGETALGSVLQDVLVEHPGAELGAVVVLSDGHINRGPGVAEIGPAFRARSVPIVSVGIGRQAGLPDVSVRVADDKVRAVKGEPFTLRATVAGNLARARNVGVLLLDGDTVLERREVRISADSAPAEVEFSVTPLTAGRRTYTVRIEPPDDDARADNNADFAPADVRDPDRFRILYAAASPGWEYRFLRVFAQRNEQIELAASIRTGKDTWYREGLTEAETPESGGLPPARELLAGFDAVVADLRLPDILSPAEAEALRGFVENRGGGLLAVGSADALPETFRDILPVSEIRAVTSSGRDLRIELDPDFIFSRDRMPVPVVPSRFVLPPTEPIAVTRALKRGGREAARIGGTGDVLLAAQRYGRGRVAFLGTEGSWRIRLGSGDGEAGHDAFWGALLAWLGSTGNGRLRATCDGSKTSLGEAIPADVDVLGPDFRPAPDADIVAEVRKPDGSIVEVGLMPAAETPGRYRLEFHPDTPGEYRVVYRVRLPEERFEESAAFLARRSGEETENTEYREDVLRDLARITNGRFLRADELPGLADIPLSPAVPAGVERRRATATPFPFLALIACLAAEWTTRRRLGLK